MNQTKIQTIKAAIEQTDGRFFTVTFIKKDGTERTMNCRTKVVKHLVGGPRKYDGNDKRDGDITIGVYEAKSEKYRCFKASKVTSLSIDKNIIKFA